MHLWTCEFQGVCLSFHRGRFHLEWYLHFHGVEGRMPAFYYPCEIWVGHGPEKKIKSWFTSTDAKSCKFSKKHLSNTM